MRIVRPGLIIVILAWLAACAESYVDPPMQLRAVSPALADYKVNRPGRILFDREARKSVLSTLAPAQRQALCGQPKQRWPSHPVVKTVNARDDGGPDDRSEPFAWTVMNEAAVAYGLDDDYAQHSLVRLLDRWARSGGLTRLNESEANVYYAVDRSLLPTLVAWSLVRDAPDVERERAERIERWLRRVARLRGDLRPRSSEGDLTSRNNHRYLSASVSMAWGALAGEDSYFREGFAAFDRALADMRTDGSLPLETERGARALWYQRHAIASLVTIAEIGAVQGYDLYGLEEDGRSLHTAVRFLLDAIDNPDLVEAYAAADYKPGTAQDPEDQDLSFLEARGHGRHYMAWAELYMARFPDREESHRLLALLERKEPGFRPMIDDYSGGNTTCFVARPESPHANGAGEVPAPFAKESSSAAQRE